MDLKKKLQKAVAGISICAMALSLIVVTVPADAAGKVKLNKTKLNMAAGSKLNGNPQRQRWLQLRKRAAIRPL